VAGAQTLPLHNNSAIVLLYALRSIRLQPIALFETRSGRARVLLIGDVEGCTGISCDITIDASPQIGTLHHPDHRDAPPWHDPSQSTTLKPCYHYTSSTTKWPSTLAITGMFSREPELEVGSRKNEARVMLNHHYDFFRSTTIADHNQLEDKRSTTIQPTDTTHKLILTLTQATVMFIQRYDVL